MKSLFGIVILCLGLFVVCSEGEKNNGGGSAFLDPVAGIMPDSSLMQVDMERLYALRDSNRMLYERSKEQGRYQEAVGYNALYRTYNDSIQQLQRNRELAEVRATYDQEKLIGIQNQLVLEKRRMQLFWLIAVVVCLGIGGGVVLLYQRRMIRKARAVREAKKRLLELTGQIALNELTIRSNEKFIRSLREQLDPSIELAVDVGEQQADIERLNESNTQLAHQNVQLEGEMKKYASLLPDDETRQADIERLVEEHLRLQEKRDYFLELLIRQLDIIGALKENIRYIDDVEGKQLMEEMDALYPGFVAYLRDTFPKLSDLNLLTCCLIKLEFSIPQMALITGVGTDMVSKRKQRIKADMREGIPDIWERGESLEMYLRKLTPHRKKTTMTKYVIYGLLSCLLVSIGCRTEREEALLPGLVQAEAMMWDEPKEALAVLDTMRVPVDDANQYATWCLLYTQAQNENRISFTSDSLIRIAVHYFEHQGDVHHKAMAWFYAGLVYADLRQTVEAAGFYVKAREAALQTTDHRLQYLICLKYGWLCLNQMALDQAKELLHEAYTHANESGIGKCRVTALDYIGRYYAFNQQMDSAALFLEQSVGLARQVTDSSNLAMALNDAAIAYYRIYKYDKAISYLRESVEIKRILDNSIDFYPSYHNIGNIYRNLGQADSAVFYFNKALGTNNLSLIRSCYFSLTEVNNDIGQWQEAVHYADLFWQYTDSIAQFTYHREVTELHAQSEYQRLENINSQLGVEKSGVLRIGFYFLACIVGVAFTLVYLFQRNLLRIEQTRLSVQEQLREQLRVYQANEQEINEGNETIRSIIKQFMEQNLWAQNDILLFEKGLLKYMKLTRQLKRTPKHLTSETKRILNEEIEAIYPGFIARFSRQYSSLSPLKIETCYLTKLHFLSSEIAKMTGVETKTVTKLKSRIKKEMGLANYTSLDEYLWAF